MSLPVFYTYILKSLDDGKYYYGSTSNLEKRLKEHNSGKVKFTRGHKPYIIHYFERYGSRKDAINRERFFKSIEGYKWLKSEGIT